jgi:hypothetical protein
LTSPGRDKAEAAVDPAAASVAGAAGAPWAARDEARMVAGTTTTALPQKAAQLLQGALYPFAGAIFADAQRVSHFRKIFLFEESQQQRVSIGCAQPGQ